MFRKTIQKTMLTLGGLLLVIGQTSIPAAQAADLFGGQNTIYIHAATSADPIIFNHNNTTTNVTIKVAEDTEQLVVKEVEDNYEPTVDDIKEYVRNEAKKAGLSIREVEIIINCESRWDPKAKGYNRNGSYDLGLWQINSIHKTLSDAEKLDYKTATKWAIEKRLREGNWSAWSCSRKLAVK